jgi:hypothetical protein
VEKEMNGLKNKVKKCDLELVNEESTPQKLVFHFPVGKDVKPEEISVTVKDHQMTIEIKRERKSKDGSFRKYEEHSRRVPLPKYIDVKEIQTSFIPDGILRIEAKLPKEELHHPHHYHHHPHGPRRGSLKTEMTPEGFLRVSTPSPTKELEKGREIPVHHHPSGGQEATEEKPSGCLQH